MIPSMSGTLDEQLDAEYRSLVSALHKDTVDTVVAVQQWWQPDCFRIVSLGGYTATGDDDEAAAREIERDWRDRVHPRLLTLVYGHPDPDVRFAADILDKRLWSMIMILSRPRPDDYARDEENSVAIHLTHDGFTRLRRAIYHAPFRVHRPLPDFDGNSVGNTEPLPGRMLKTIKQLQEAGVLPSESPMPGGDISEAVRRLSDILFMPEDERAKLFAENDVEDPSSDPETDTEEQEVKFGFSFPGN